MSGVRKRVFNTLCVSIGLMLFLATTSVRCGLVEQFNAQANSTFPKQFCHWYILYPISALSIDGECVVGKVYEALKYINDGCFINIFASTFGDCLLFSIQGVARFIIQFTTCACGAWLDCDQQAIDDAIMKNWKEPKPRLTC